MTLFQLSPHKTYIKHLGRQNLLQRIDEAIATLSRGSTQHQVDVVHGDFNFVIVEPSDVLLGTLHNSSVERDRDVDLVHVAHGIAELRVVVRLSLVGIEWAVLAVVVFSVALATAQGSQHAAGARTLERVANTINS